ncbi:ABC transporter substrate-binding protein [Myxococcota bacterium]|nr:ABC transporter substrate-binding protein [Myxococcota bacterium]
MLTATLAFGAFVLPGELLAAEASATEALKARDAEVRAALPPKGQPVTPAVRQKIEVILTKLVDLESMAKATLGKHWEAQTPAKQKEFLDTFLTSFRSALSGDLEAYRKSATTFEAEQPENGTIRVPTTLVIKDEPAEVVYTMKKDDAGWRILDITIDGVSTVENYRSSFGRIIQKEGFDALINRLKKPAK